MQEKNLSSQNIWIFEDFFDTESWHQGKQREHCRKLSGELHFWTEDFERTPSSHHKNCKWRVSHHSWSTYFYGKFRKDECIFIHPGRWPWSMEWRRSIGASIVVWFNSSHFLTRAHVFLLKRRFQNEKQCGSLHSIIFSPIKAYVHLILCGDCNSDIHRHFKYSQDNCPLVNISRDLKRKGKLLRKSKKDTWFCYNI